jgi:hypothetical protein
MSKNEQMNNFTHVDTTGTTMKRCIEQADLPIREVRTLSGSSQT